MLETNCLVCGGKLTAIEPPYAEFAKRGIVNALSIKGPKLLLRVLLQVEYYKCQDCGHPYIEDWSTSLANLAWQQDNELLSNIYEVLNELEPQWRKL